MLMHVFGLKLRYIIGKKSQRKRGKQKRSRGEKRGDKGQQSKIEEIGQIRKEEFDGEIRKDSQDKEEFKYTESMQTRSTTNSSTWLNKTLKYASIYNVLSCANYTICIKIIKLTSECFSHEV